MFQIVHPSSQRRLCLVLCLMIMAFMVAQGFGNPSASAAQLTSPALAPSDTTTGLLGRWSLNDGANPTTDSSGNNRDGTLSGNPSFTTDTPATLPGTALDFDGVNDTITVSGAESAFDLNVITIALWINVDSFTKGYQAIITKGDSAWRIQRNDNTNQIHFATNGLSNVTLNSTISLNDNQWHHVVAIYDGTTKYLYIDGVLNASSPASGTIGTNNTPVVIGTNGDITSRYFDGQMDDIRIYSRALSASDVAELYAYTNTAPTAQNDTYATMEDVTLTVPAPGVISNDDDVDGDILSAALVEAPSNGSLALDVSGSFVYTPTANFFGTDSFTYTIYEGTEAPPLGYWKFDDGINPTADSSGNGNSGSLLNGAAFSTTVPLSLTTGQSMSFDGNNDRVDVTGIDIANSSFTVQAWVKRSAATGTSDFILGQGTSGSNNVLHVGFRNSNQFTCAFWNNDLNTTATYTDTNWHHWSCTYDSGTRRRVLYLDGVEVASDTAATHYQGTGTFSIGSRDNGSDPFPGLIDDVRIYDHALSASKVAASMNTIPDAILSDTATVTITVGSVDDQPVALDDTYTTIQGTPLTSQYNPGSLTTQFTANNSQDGNMFDVVAKQNDIVITGFNVHIDTAGTHEVIAYYKAGTHDGFETTPAAWTLLGTGNVTTTGSGNAAYLDLGGLTIPAGETYGLYLSVTNTNVSFRYTTGDFPVSNDALTITSGTGQAYPFGSINQPRTWNGTIFYLEKGGVLWNDSDVESLLTGSVSSQPSNGSLTFRADSTFIYTPTVSFIGQDTFTYIASDGVLTDTATVTITVTPAQCTVESSGDALTDYASNDASALQDAVMAAAPGATLKVAGICMGVETNQNTTQTLLITQNLTIQGGYTQTQWLASSDPSAYPTVLDADNQGRVVVVDGAIDVTLDNLSLMNGTATGGAGLLIQDGATVTATNSLFTENTASSHGSAISNEASTLFVSDSTFTENTSVNGSLATIGVASTTVQASSFYTNTVTRGGGIYNDPSGHVRVENSTFAYNTATEGGAIHNRGVLTATHTTMAYNTATFGRALHTWDGSMALYNNILGDNQGTGAECQNDGTITANVNNLIEDGTCSPTVIEEPRLEKLQDNGGATWTIALMDDSPAIDAADTATCLATDQRGASRPEGTDCDMGAYEADQELITLTIVGSGSVVSEPAGIQCNATCTEGFITGTTITMTAMPDTGSTFTGWSGACTGTGVCMVTLDQAQSVTATFTLNSYALNVTTTGTGSGTVLSNIDGINCGSDCSETYDHGTVVILTATADAGSTFTGWSGACTGTGTCEITIDQARNVTANFEMYRLMLPVILK